jgi:hypothetical protein
MGASKGRRQVKYRRAKGTGRNAAVIRHRVAEAREVQLKDVKVHAALDETDLTEALQRMRRAPHALHPLKADEPAEGQSLHVTFTAEKEAWHWPGLSLAWRIRLRAIFWLLILGLLCIAGAAVLLVAIAKGG